jgi:predicted HicB family RNase H-like nuclease
MSRTKTGEFNQIAYQNEFNKRNYDRIEIKVPKGRKAVIKAAATAAGQSVNEFIAKAIDERMEKDGDSEAARKG